MSFYIFPRRRVPGSLAAAGAAAWLRSIALYTTLVTVLALVAVPGQDAYSATFDVTKSADTADGLCDADCSLREAIIAANALPGPDVINLPANTYIYQIPGAAEDLALTGDLDILDDVTLLGAGLDTTVVDAAALDRAFTVFQGVRAEFVQLTIRNGATVPDPAGTVQDSGGAGIYNLAGFVSIRGVVLSGNVDTGYGGAIYNSIDWATGLAGSMEIVDSVLAGNCAWSGGAINSEAGLTIIATTIANNGASGSCAAYIGGGLSINEGDVTIDGSTIVGNIAADGGGIRNHGGFLRILNSTIAHNQGERGGGLHNRVDGVMTIINTTIAENDATLEGGGLYGDNWGQVAGRETVAEIANSIVAHNRAPAGPDCFTAANGVDVTNSAIRSLGHNLIGDPIDCTIDPAPDAGDLLGDPGLDTYSVAARPGGGHFPLLPTSQAVDAGADLFCPPLDQIEQLRPIDGNGDGLPACDIGAYELQAPGMPLPPVIKLLPPIIGPGGEVCLDASASYDPDGVIVVFGWEWGDGSPPEQTLEPYACHVYAVAGTYALAVTAVDEMGLISEISLTVTIMPNAPVANAGGPYSGVVGDAIQFDGRGSYDFDGTIIAYDWAFGDGSAGVGATPMHAYAFEGIYRVTMVVTDNDGLTGSAGTSADIALAPRLQPPVADAGGPYVGQAGQPVVLDGSASSDADGTIVRYEWTAPDGTIVCLTPVCEWLPPPGTAGTYALTLCVTDNDGLTSCATTTVTLAGQPPVADPGGPYSGTAGMPVTIDGSGSYDLDGVIVGYEWDLGDGSRLSGVATFDHVYSAGSYAITLVVVDNDGQAATGVTSADIAPAPQLQPPVANAGGPYSGGRREALTFDGSGSTDADGRIVSYTWNFGDGQTGTGMTVSHSYRDNGVYAVTLFVTDNDGLSATDTTTAEIARGGGKSKK